MVSTIWRVGAYDCRRPQMLGGRAATGSGSWAQATSPVHRVRIADDGVR